MMEEESGLFQVSFNEQGKKFIRKFAAISYTILVLVIFQSAISVYWSIIMLVNDNGFTTAFYDKVYPYMSIFFSIWRWCLIFIISAFHGYCHVAWNLMMNQAPTKHFAYFSGELCFSFCGCCWVQAV